MLNCNYNTKCQKRTAISLNVKQVLLPFRALTRYEKLRMCPQISNELHDNVLRHRKLSFGQVDVFY